MLQCDQRVDDVPVVPRTRYIVGNSLRCRGALADSEFAPLRPRDGGLLQQRVIASTKNTCWHRVDEVLQHAISSAVNHDGGVGAPLPFTVDWSLLRPTFERSPSKSFSLLGFAGPSGWHRFPSHLALAAL